MYRVIAVIIGLIALLIIGGILIFSIFDGGEQRQVEEIKRLESFAATDTQVRMTINGPIVANRDHRIVQITVGRLATEAVIFKGYEGDVLRSETYSNNQESYASFLAGLEGLGFNKERAYSGKQNELGACPSGQRIVFDTFDGNENIQHTWTTSCSSDIGTFGGKLGAVENLFEDQVPDYNDFVRGVQF